jgi:hypothetical protein
MCFFRIRAYSLERVDDRVAEGLALIRPVGGALGLSL